MRRRFLLAAFGRAIAISILRNAKANTFSCLRRSNFQTVAADLGIRRLSVKLYLRSVWLKLGAATSHQAVGKASFLELIEL
ncbi:hypothetical protein [Neorhizobium sp. R1-B]|uniref:hypothetical protein n=1 Tax=Neorhizobium sp. R1-B TaxID=2485162 RepID=UPI001FE0BCAB|nr:hypothetical protein [Neorhizobium sp. R1-B]